jgi:arylmalonate decarboxylase
MVPANNTTVARELSHWLPPTATVDVVRIPRGAGLLTPATLPAYRDHALTLARQFAREEVDVVGYGCTAAGFILGPEGDRALTADLQTTTGKPVVTIAHAMNEALRALGVTRVALVTPYSRSVNEALTAYIGSVGIAVAALDSFYAADVEALGRITAPEVADLARRTMTDDCEAMFIACAQLPTADVLDVLGAEFRRPVLSSVQCLAARIAAVAPGA